VLSARHAAPPVGHWQPWRFIVVRAADTRKRAAVLADRERLVQAAAFDGDSGQHLLDLQLEGIREAPLGVVIAGDRRTAALGVLGLSAVVAGLIAAGHARATTGTYQPGSPLLSAVASWTLIHTVFIFR